MSNLYPSDSARTSNLKQSVKNLRDLSVAPSELEQWANREISTNTGQVLSPHEQETSPVTKSGCSSPTPAVLSGDSIPSNIEFLRALNPQTILSFIILDDTGKKRSGHARFIHGSFTDLEPTLRGYNKKGFGVYVTVNETDGKARATGNIKYLRAIMADFDAKEMATRPFDIEAVKNFKMKPHYIIETSKGSYHVWWFIEPVEAKPESNQIWKAIHEGVASRFNSDPTCSDLPRVLRVPGFNHCKKEPVLVRIVYANQTQPLFTLQQFATEFITAPLPAAFVPDFTGEPNDELNNQILAALQQHGLLNRKVSPTKYEIDCPFGATHSNGRKDGACFMLGGYNGYEQPNFHCQHDHCKSKTRRDFLEAIGINPEPDFSSWDGDIRGESAEAEFDDVDLAALDLVFNGEPVENTPLKDSNEPPKFPFDNFGDRDRYNYMFEDTLYDPTSTTNEKFIQWKESGDQSTWEFVNNERLHANCEIMGNHIIDTAKNQKAALIKNIDPTGKTQDQVDDIKNKIHSKFNYIIEHGKKLRSVYYCNQVISALRGVAAIQKKKKEFDTNPLLLGTPNGTVDLRTGLVHTPVKSELILRHTLAKFDPTATCPEWLNIIDKITGGDKPFSEFLQIMAGYTLSGLTGERKAFVIESVGDGGASTFLRALTEVWGDYARVIRADTLMKSDAAAEFELATTEGSRLMSIDESEAGEYLGGGLIKRLTSGTGSKMSGALKGENAKQMNVTQKIIISTNHAPRVKHDPAIYKRLIIIPFSNKITVTNMNISADLIGEYSGILNWCIQGFLKYQALTGGLSSVLPRQVKDAMAKFQLANNTIKQFFDEYFQPSTQPNAVVSCKDVWEFYADWTKNDKSKGLGKIRFYEQITAMGFPQVNGAHNILYFQGMEKIDSDLESESEIKRRRGWL